MLYSMWHNIYYNCLSLSIVISIITKSLEYAIFNFVLINCSEGSNNFIYLRWRLTWINTVGQLEFLIIVKFRWRKRLIILVVLRVKYVISISSAQNIWFLHRSLFHSFCFINTVSYISHVWLYSLAIKRSGDIGENPGPKPNSCGCLSICHWNLNSISSHNLIKLSLPCAYISINKIDVICLSGTYLDSSISSDNDNLVLPRCNLVRADNPTYTKRGSVCIYYHNFLPLKVIDIQPLNECINFEKWKCAKLCSFLCLYRSPSQTRDIFETFADNFELTLDLVSNKHSFLIVALGDFNAKTTNWYKNDINSYEGLKTDTINHNLGYSK